MSTVIFIAIICLIIYLLFFLGKKTTVDTSTYTSQKETLDHLTIPDEEKIVTYMDESGREYKLVETIKTLPRKTYIHGILKGKYWGELNFSKGEKYEYSRFYNFRIYEAHVNVTPMDGCSCIMEVHKKCPGYHKAEEGPFVFTGNDLLPGDRLPTTISCAISINNELTEYSVKLHDLQLRNIAFNRKLHQEDNNEVFGTIEAEITAYLLDFIYETHLEKEYITNDTGTPQALAQEKESNIDSEATPTGRVEYDKKYKRVEYISGDYKSKYWGNWIYQDGNNKADTSFLSFLTGLLGLVVGVIFLIAILPHLAIVLPFILLAFLFNLVNATVLNWILRIIAGLLLVIFIIFLFNSSNKKANTYIPKVTSAYRRKELIPRYEPFTDTANNLPVKDTLITHFCSWKDYDGKSYEGKFYIKSRDYQNAHFLKNELVLTKNNVDNYDEIIYRLKEHDKNKLNGIYTLFDSLKLSNSLNSEKFAEVIVAFVQSIPYSLILPGDCDPSLYSDKFIKRYLLSPSSSCVGFEPLGINTPVEFLATLKGDCDTRTLLLYTILAHYGYDLILLSSEFYGHSLLGINLPYTGKTYTFQTKHYTLWETTAADIRPGILPDEISNVNHWRISLKSK